MTTLEELLTGYQLYFTLFSYMLPHTLYNIRLLNKAHKRLVDDYMQETFNLDIFLARFFPSKDLEYIIAKKFRAIMAATGAIIGGSTALQFLSRKVFIDSDMDLYVNRKGEMQKEK